MLTTSKALSEPDTLPLVSPGWPRPARYVVAILLLLAGLALLVLATPIAAVTVWSFVFAFVLDIPARYLTRRARFSYPASLLITYALVSLVFAAAVLGGGRYLVDGLQELYAGLKQALPGALDNLAAALGAAGGTGTPPAILQLARTAAELAIGMLGFALGMLINMGVAIVRIGLEIVVSCLLLLNLNGSRGFLRHWISAAYDREVTLLLAALDVIWCRFLGVQLIYGSVITVASIVQYELMGVPYPIVMAILTGIISLIPTVGGLLASLLVAVPCLMFGSTKMAMSPAAFTVLVLIINVIKTQASYILIVLPLLGKAVKLPMWIVLLGVTLGLSVGQPVIAFLIVPVIGTIRLLGSYGLDKVVVGRLPFAGQDLPARRPDGFFSQAFACGPVKKPAG